MITEEQIKKAAKKVLGEENKDWFYKVEKGHERWVRRVWTQCEHCNSYLHVLFDLRECLNENHRSGPESMRRLKQIKVHNDR